MTGSGKTALGVCLLEEALRAGVPVIALDEGRPHQPSAVPEPRTRRTSGPGSTTRRPRRRPVPRRVRRRPADEVDRRARSLAVGRSESPPGSPAPSDYLHAGLDVGRAGNLVGSLQVPADKIDGETSPTRSMATYRRCWACDRIDADPLSSREHILIANLIHTRGNGDALDLPTLVGQVAASRRSASRACSNSTSSSPRRTAWGWR